MRTCRVAFGHLLTSDLINIGPTEMSPWTLLQFSPRTTITLLELPFDDVLNLTFLTSDP